MIQSPSSAQGVTLARHLDSVEQAGKAGELVGDFGGPRRLRAWRESTRVVAESRCPLGRGQGGEGSETTIEPQLYHRRKLAPTFESIFKMG